MLVLYNLEKNVMDVDGEVLTGMHMTESKVRNEMLL
jgi:hypothetical protein